MFRLQTGKNGYREKKCILAIMKYRRPKKSSLFCKHKRKICESNEWSATCTLTIAHSYSHALNKRKRKQKKARERKENGVNEQVWIKYHEYDGVHHYIFTHELVHRIRSHCLRDFSPHAMPKWCVSVSRFYFCINIHAQSLFLSVFSSDLWSKIIIDSLSALTGTGPYPSFHCMNFPVYNFISRIIIVSWF